jgi:hypothetical protein
MITLNEWMELINYRVAEGSEYCWKCFGKNAYVMHTGDDNEKTWDTTIIFDLVTKEVYSVQLHDYKHGRAYRIIAPAYKKQYNKEASKREFNQKEAWEGIDYIDLEQDYDLLTKCKAMQDGIEYDTRVSISSTIPNDVLFELMKKAHEEDITLNQLVEMVLWKDIRAEETKHDVA